MMYVNQIIMLNTLNLFNAMCQLGASLVAQCKEPAYQCRRLGFDSLGQEGPLEKEMATHSTILAWEIPWTEDPGGLQSMGPQKSQTWLSD